MSKILLLLKNTLTALMLIGLVMLAPLRSYSQSNTVSGTVKTVDGEELPGVSVIEKGTTNGTTTDIDGNYQLRVSNGATLVFSFIGMEPQQVEVGSKSVLNVVLNEDIQQLQEVVVVGYGTQKRSNLTGSVASVDGDDLKKMPVSTVAESLTGRLPGVQVTTTEGSPDAEINIRVRGGASLTQSSSPLYIVDGFPVSTISDLTPSDIESIDVLKDAASTAIYGSRGANGVVLITTKSGKAGKVTVSFNSFYAIKKIAKTLDVLDAEDYVHWQYEYAVLDDQNDPNEPGYLSSYEDYFGLFEDIDLYKGQPSNDWQRQIYGRTGSTFSNDLSLRGGSEKFSYSANFARYDDKAIMIGSDYLRNNITLKLRNQPNDKIDINFSLRYSDTEISGGGSNEQDEVSSQDSRLKHAVAYAPIPISGVSVPDDTNEQISSDLVNPIVATADNNRLQKRRNFNVGASLGWEVIDGLELKTSFTLDDYTYKDNRFYGVTTYKARDKSPDYPNLPSVAFRDRDSKRLRNTNTITYDVLKEGEHQLKLLVGQEILFTETNDLTYEVQGYPALFTSDEAFKLTTQGHSIYADNNYSPDDKLFSLFGRANYSFRDRYLLTAVYRADGSSRFLGDNVWGYFPSVSAGWKISEESFMQGIANWVNEMKLRASWGYAGNNNIPSGQTVQSFVSSSTQYINNVTSYWAPSSVLANPDLKWETTETRNIGLDFGLLKGRVNGTFEVYQNNTRDLLIRFPVSGTGYEYQYRNMGETENRGLEIGLNLIAIDREKYGLSASFNISFNRNKIKSLGIMDELLGQEVTTGWASTQIGHDYQAKVGDPVGTMYGYVNDGRYEVSDFEGYDENTGEWVLKGGTVDSEVLGVAPGMMKLRDLNGDGVVTLDDQKDLGNAAPKHTGGFVLNGYAYGFDLTAAFNWSYGNDIYNANKIEFTTANQNNQYRNLIDMQAEGKRWTNIDWNTGELITNPTQLAAVNANTTMWSPFMDRYVFSDWAVEDGSFLRLNTLTLGYTLPHSIVERMKVQSLRFYVTGYNVFVLTNYSGYDPEVSTRRKTPLTPGVDYSAYPRSRQITFGLNLTF